MSLCVTSAEFHFSKYYVPPKLVSSTEHELTESHQLHEDYCDMECLWGSCLPGWEESWQTCLKESWTALLSLSPENTDANMYTYVTLSLWYRKIKFIADIVENIV